MSASRLVGMSAVGMHACRLAGWQAGRPAARLSLPYRAGGRGGETLTQAARNDGVSAAADSFQLSDGALVRGALPVGCPHAHPGQLASQATYCSREQV